MFKTYFFTKIDIFNMLAILAYTTAKLPNVELQMFVKQIQIIRFTLLTQVTCIPEILLQLLFSSHHLLWHEQHFHPELRNPLMH